MNKLDWSKKEHYVKGFNPKWEHDKKAYFKDFVRGKSKIELHS